MARETNEKITMQNTKIGFIGAGNMSTAIIKGLIEKGYDSGLIYASNRGEQKLLDLKKDFNINITLNNTDVTEKADIVILAVKPQIMAEVCQKLTSSKPLYVSIAAGVPMSRFKEILPQNSKVIRVMPNTPCAIGMGASGIYTEDKNDVHSLQLVEAIMQSVGSTAVVDKESDLDTVIACAGSSPAYFFLIAEAMQKQAIAMGLSADSARSLIQQTMLGSAALMIDQSDLEFSELRTQVTSKGGTTAKAIECLQQGELENLFGEAMQAAVTRAQEMAKLF